MTRPKVLFIYKDTSGKHRWRLKAGNGANLCTPGEGFVTLTAAERNAGSALGGTVKRGAFGHGMFEGRDGIRVEYER